MNLAFILSDGCRVRIPSVDEKDTNYSIVSSSSGENIVTYNDGKMNDNANDTNFNKGNARIKNGAKVNINTASQAELETLTGVGPSIASKIIEYRKINGKFKRLEELKNVSGIGEEKYNSLKGEICIK